jgi:hypothetical protein
MERTRNKCCSVSLQFCWFLFVLLQSVLCRYTEMRLNLTRAAGCYRNQSGDGFRIVWEWAERR